jgi:hypothetical protein
MKKLLPLVFLAALLGLPGQGEACLYCEDVRCREVPWWGVWVQSGTECEIRTFCPPFGTTCLKECRIGGIQCTFWDIIF